MAEESSLFDTALPLLAFGGALAGGLSNPYVGPRLFDQSMSGLSFARLNEYQKQYQRHLHAQDMMKAGMEAIELGRPDIAAQIQQQLQAEADLTIPFSDLAGAQQQQYQRNLQDFNTFIRGGLSAPSSPPAQSPIGSSSLMSPPIGVEEPPSLSYAPGESQAVKQATQSYWRSPEDIGSLSAMAGTPPLGTELPIVPVGEPPIAQPGQPPVQTNPQIPTLPLANIQRTFKTGPGGQSVTATLNAKDVQSLVTDRVISEALNRQFIPALERLQTIKVEEIPYLTSPLINKAQVLKEVMAQGVPMDSAARESLDRQIQPYYDAAYTALSQFYQQRGEPRWDLLATRQATMLTGYAPAGAGVRAAKPPTPEEVRNLPLMGATDIGSAQAAEQQIYEQQSKRAVQQAEEETLAKERAQLQVSQEAPVYKSQRPLIRITDDLGVEFAPGMVSEGQAIKEGFRPVPDEKVIVGLEEAKDWHRDLTRLEQLSREFATAYPGLTNRLSQGFETLKAQAGQDGRITKILDANGQPMTLGAVISEYERVRDQLLGNVARTMGGERGVLTNQDIARQLSGFATKWDTNQLASSMFRSMKSRVERGMNKWLTMIEGADAAADHMDRWREQQGALPPNPTVPPQPGVSQTPGSPQFETSKVPTVYPREPQKTAPAPPTTPAQPQGQPSPLRKRLEALEPK